MDAPRCTARTKQCRWGIPAAAGIFRALKVAKPCRCIKPETHAIAIHVCAHSEQWAGAGNKVSA